MREPILKFEKIPTDLSLLISYVSSRQSAFIKRVIRIQTFFFKLNSFIWKLWNFVFITKIIVVLSRVKKHHCFIFTLFISVNEEDCSWNKNYGNYRTVCVACVVCDVTIYILLLPDFTVPQNTDPSESLARYRSPSDHTTCPLHRSIYCTGETIGLPRGHRKLHSHIPYGTNDSFLLRVKCYTIFKLYFWCYPIPLVTNQAVILNLVKIPVFFVFDFMCCKLKHKAVYFMGCFILLKVSNVQWGGLGIFDWLIYNDGMMKTNDVHWTCKRIRSGLSTNYSHMYIVKLG